MQQDWKAKARKLAVRSKGLSILFDAAQHCRHGIKTSDYRTLADAIMRAKDRPPEQADLDAACRLETIIDNYDRL